MAMKNVAITLFLTGAACLSLIQSGPVVSCVYPPPVEFVYLVIGMVLGFGWTLLLVDTHAKLRSCS